MSKHLQTELVAIERALSRQAEVVERMVETAYRGLHSRCLGTAAEVLSHEAELNKSEVQIEEQCLSALALHQPVAVDLRRVTATLKINADLERIGDLALNLAERTESLASFPGVHAPEALELMVERAIEMVRDAHLAFVRLDANLAKSICERDNEINRMNREIIAELVAQMEASPDRASGYLHIFSASRIVERIADHATNMAEDVLYLVGGEITRHGLRLHRSA